MKSSPEDHFEKLQFFLITTNESTDTAQLEEFVRGIKKNVHAFEEFVELISLKNTTTGADILKALLQCLAAKNLNFFTLVSITTDGASSMVGKNKGVVSLLQKHMKNNKINNSIMKLVSYSSGSRCKGGKLQKHHGRSGENCELYFFH